jgi:hypothetical protein
MGIPLISKLSPPESEKWRALATLSQFFVISLKKAMLERITSTY